MQSFRVVAYNFLAGGSRKRTGHWTRVARALAADVILAQECRRPEHFQAERFRPKSEDALHWTSVGESRWGSAVYARSARLVPIALERHDGWVVGGELQGAAWSNGRTIRVFSVHGPVGERGYIRTMHEILDQLAPFAEGADLLLGGDFNFVVGDRQPTEKRTVSRAEREILDRLADQFELVSCWQAANPGRPLAQTLRWTGDRKEPYHCDGIFAPRSWQARLVSCRVVRGSRWYQMSDHNPVVAEFTF
jgi:endonuclease/exonuclease/phosphatase family metal-dependent hydrolase